MNKRRSRIFELVKQEREISVQQLVTILGASEATIRRDLVLLESEMKIFRTFGGARIIDDFTKVAHSFQERSEKNNAEKLRIAEAAAAHVRPGMVIAVDNGTTTWMTTKYLREVSPLTIITNSLPIVQSLYDVPEITLICSGGKFRDRNIDFIGNTAVNTFRKWHTDISFISGDSMVAELGVYKLEEESAAIVEAMTFSTNQSIVLMDSTKYLSKKAAYLALPANKIDILITNEDENCDKDHFNNCSYKVTKF